MGSIRRIGNLNDLKWQISVELLRESDGKRRRQYETIHGCKRDAVRRMNELQDIHDQK
ncbi:MAG: hypothetical protein ABFD46_09320 [Armatimonadota bacterium]